MQTPGYWCKKRRARKINPYMGWIEGVLNADRNVPGEPEITGSEREPDASPPSDNDVILKAVQAIQIRPGKRYRGTVGAPLRGKAGGGKQEGESRTPMVSAGFEAPCAVGFPTFRADRKVGCPDLT